MKVCFRKYFSILLFCIFVLNTQFADANSEFKNNLLKLDINKTSPDKVKFSLYTNKSYNDSVVVNRKSDTEYVILMPETANSLTAKPSSGNASDVIKSIEIKTQQYQNNLKGYTKILVTTVKPIEITSNIHVLPPSQVQLSEKEYSELLAQIVKNKSASLNKEMNNLKKIKIKPAATAETKIAKTEKPQKQTALTTEKRTTKNISKKTVSQSDIKKQTAEKETLPQTQELNTQTDKTTQEKGIVKKEPATEGASTPPIGVEQKNITPATTQVSDSNQSKLHRIKNIIVSDLYYIIGIVAAIFITLLFLARKMTKNTHKQKEFFTENLEEKPVSVADFTDKISDDMTWKEKYQTYLDATQVDEKAADESPAAEGLISQNELDGLFGKDAETKINKDSKTEIRGENSGESFSPAPPVEETISPFTEDDLINSLFDEEETSTENIPTDKAKISFAPSPQTQEDEIIKSEYAIDDEKLLYLVDFEEATALVGRIEDEIFVLKKFEEKINAPIQARLNERKGNSTNYMTKIGSFKAIVQVTPEKMDLLIEL